MERNIMDFFGFRKSMMKPVVLIAIFCIQFLLLGSQIALCQNKTVSGTVTDAQTGKTLPGVNILVTGTSTGTTTDAGGHYSLNVPSMQDTLRFSFIGYKTQVIPINNKTTINIELNPTVFSGKQMVVIGYGNAKEQDLTGSVGSVQMESIDTQPVTNVNSSLAGQIAGVHINVTNGVPGGGPQIRIRGVGAIGAGSSPLYVVDGFPLPAQSETSLQVSNPLNNIPTSDIASISVLKGPSATAIYGSRAANGVVIIKTKSGRRGELQTQVNVYGGVQNILNSEIPNMMNAREFATFEKQWIQDKNRVKGTNIPIPKEYQDPSQYGEGTNWFRAVTRRVAPVENISVRTSGGNKNIKSYFSGNFFRQKGVVKETDYNRISLRANIDANITKKLQMGMKFSPTYSYGNTGEKGADGRHTYMGKWTFLSPIAPIYNKDGSFNKFITGPGVGGPGSTLLGGPNPLFALKTSTNKTNKANILASGYVTYNITNSLALKSTVHAEWHNSRNHWFHPSTIGGLGSPPPHPAKGRNTINGWLNWVNENQLTYDHTFKGGHQLKLLGVFSEQRQLFHSSKFTATQFPDNNIITLNAANDITGGTDAQTWSLVSYLGRLKYSYKNRYLFTGTLRRDGSSKFGSHTRWGLFPSVSAGWQISNEPWIANNIPLISNLKIRAGYGLSGNNQIGSYAYSSRITKSNYILNNSLAVGKGVSKLANQNLAWEQTKELDIGLDIGLFSSRLNVTADYYRSTTKSLLLNVDLPFSSGFPNALRNIGKVRNHGLEIAIKTLNVSTNDFKWNSNLNFSINRNRVLALGPNGRPITKGTAYSKKYSGSITKIGKPIGMFWGYKFLGLYQNEEEIKKGPSYAGAVPGALKLADINGDGKIEAIEDFTIVGNPYPDFTYGMTNSFSYKGLNLNIVITGSYGAERFKGSYLTTHNTDGIFNVLADQKNRWRSPEHPGNGKIPTTVGSRNRIFYRSMGAWDILNASYLRVNNISLSYSLPHRFTNGHLRGLVIYTSIQNAFVITPYPGNPSATTYSRGSVLQPGVDFNPYPAPRVSTIGIKIKI
jgi:TonB-linked SusC/RagA family outer membrane protein